MFPVVDIYRYSESEYNDTLVAGLAGYRLWQAGKFAG